jgi:serine protease Do
MITRQLAVLNEIPEGAYVMTVVDGSPAAKAGVEADDIITKINGDKVSESNDLSHHISGKKVGEQVTLTIWRDGKESVVTATLGTQ